MVDKEGAMFYIGLDQINCCGFQQLNDCDVES